MKRLPFALVAGILFGLVAVGLRATASSGGIAVPDSQAALCAAFVSRFAIGFLIPHVELALPGWAKGLLIGILLSLPEAITTGSWAPIMVVGGGGALVIGLVAGRLVKP